MSFPTDVHLVAEKCILLYLVGTQHFGICLQPGPLSLSAFSVSNWVGHPYDHHSTTGFLMYLGYNPITWSAKKQLMVSRSSTESEYRAMASTVAELCWLHQVLKDLGIYLVVPPRIWCHNVFALAIALNPVFHACTKHIKVDYHFIHKRVLCKDLHIKYISTSDQLVDFFTKSLPTSRFQILCSKLLFTMVLKVLRGGEEKIKKKNSQWLVFKILNSYIVIYIQTTSFFIKPYDTIWLRKASCFIKTVLFCYTC